MADSEWAWRDNLRRISRGEEVPAFRANEWSDARTVREKLADRLLTSELTPSVEDRATRRDLALYTLAVAAGDVVLSQGTPGMGKLLEELCIDVEWLEEIVYFSPLAHAETALPILAYIYRCERKRMANMPAHRRLAAAVAFEFALKGIDREQALKTYQFYAAGGQKHMLNNCYEELALWEMSVLAARHTDSTWSNAETLTWFRLNNRLPAHGYVMLGNSLGAHEQGLFGEQVGTPEFQTLYKDSAEGGAASMYEVSGCSTEHDRAFYAATAACANGVPALVATKAGEASCMVHVKGNWEYSAPLTEGMTCSWSFFGMNHPDFVKLASVMGAEMDKTLSSSRLAYMGQYLYSSGNAPLAQSYFRQAIKVQPMNYPAWVGYHAAGATAEEMAEGVKLFESMPGVAASLRALLAQ